MPPKSLCKRSWNSALLMNISAIPKARPSSNPSRPSARPLLAHASTDWWRTVTCWASVRGLPASLELKNALMAPSMSQAAPIGFTQPLTSGAWRASQRLLIEAGDQRGDGDLIPARGDVLLEFGRAGDPRQGRSETVAEILPTPPALAHPAPAREFPGRGRARGSTVSLLGSGTLARQRRHGIPRSHPLM